MLKMLKSRMMRKYEEMMRNHVRQVVGRSLSTQREEASGTPASLRMHGLFQTFLGRSQVAAGRSRSQIVLSKLSNCGSVSLTKLTWHISDKTSSVPASTPGEPLGTSAFHNALE